jgi:nicotinamidase-related amidase
MERVLPKIVRLTEFSSDRTVFTRFVPPRTVDDAMGAWRTYFRKWANVTGDEVDPDLLELVGSVRHAAPTAKVVDRPVYSAFAGGTLHQMLRSLKADTLVISGGETDVCVLATVLSAIDHGYRVILVEDTLVSGSAGSHHSVLQLFRTRFDVQAGVASLDDVIASWRGLERSA